MIGKKTKKIINLNLHVKMQLRGAGGRRYQRVTTNKGLYSTKRKLLHLYQYTEP